MNDVMWHVVLFVFSAGREVGLAIMGLATEKYLLAIIMGVKAPISLCFAYMWITLLP